MACSSQQGQTPERPTHTCMLRGWDTSSREVGGRLCNERDVQVLFILKSYLYSNSLSFSLTLFTNLVSNHCDYTCTPNESG